MNTLLLDELKVIAKGLGIALSYTKDGKRHKLNKPELIKAIEVEKAKQAEQVQVVESTDVQAVPTKQRTVTSNVVVAQPVKTNAIVVSGENIKLNTPQPVKLKNSSMYGENANYDAEINLNTVVKESKQLLQLGFIDKVKASIATLNNKIKDEKRNKLLVARMSQIRNILTALVKQSTKRGAVYA